MAKTNYLQAGYATITAYLIVKGAEAAIAFYTKIFGARERMRIAGPDGRIGHAELEFGTSVIMMADEHPEMNAKGPESYGGSPISIHIFVPDVDKTVEAAVADGATLLRPVADQFYGDRLGTIRDPFGHIWSVATHIEDVPDEELQRRAAAAHG